MDVPAGFLAPLPEVLLKSKDDKLVFLADKIKTYQQLVKQSGFRVPCAHVALVVITFL